MGDAGLGSDSTLVRRGRAGTARGGAGSDSAVRPAGIGGSRSGVTGCLAVAVTGCAAFTLLCSTLTGVAQAAAATTPGVPATAGKITINGPSVPMTVSSPGKSAKLTFTAKAGESVSLDLTQLDVSTNCAGLALLEPDGAQLDSNATCGNGSSIGVGPDTLPVSGTYTVKMTPSSNGTGGGVLWVSAPVGVGTVTVNGPSRPLTATRYGQDVWRTFTGKAGESVSEVLTELNSSTNCAGLRLLEPDGAQLDSNATCGNGSSFGVGPDTLPVSGTYSVELTIGPTTTGGGVLWVSAPVSVGTVTVNGPARPLEVTRYGQDVWRTFTGTAGDKVSEVLSQLNVTTGCAGLRLLAPGGGQVDSNGACGSGISITVGPDTLTTTGTYMVELIVGPPGTGGGQLKVST